MAVSTCVACNISACEEERARMDVRMFFGDRKAFLVYYPVVVSDVLGCFSVSAGHLLSKNKKKTSATTVNNPEFILKPRGNLQSYTKKAARAVKEERRDWLVVTHGVILFFAHVKNGGGSDQGRKKSITRCTYEYEYRYATYDELCKVGLPSTWHEMLSIMMHGERTGSLYPLRPFSVDDVQEFSCRSSTSIKTCL